MTEGKGRKGRARKTGREETKEKAKPKPRRKQETPQPERVVKEEKEEKDFAQLNKEWQVDEDNRWRCEWDD
ncbi:hypothetical protein AGDE_13002 [Angomonas deanei]|uniref:Uncharacterized protein n=1 Tax=Angomonas deanei TaxID=59799 RepID=A0A7G2CEJ8_9TRYP|nr:hypothetical protein AGDE_13002 [Angomonas deanei]CAD2216602.1 hypothetical protein, conserved [Angomonas deanei]|eukprot:EPY23175.1 hypothetical protein AGDE_13002 [Angomonas deanei]